MRRGSVVLVLVALLLGATPTLRVATAGERCEADGPDEVGVVVVVDFGDLEGAPGGPSVVCVSVPEGATGNDVLEARARQLEVSSPRYDSSGLLCAIDGLPEDGCGERVGSGYLYWSYWLGTGDGWEHAQEGPGFRDADPTVTEGWHFVEGSGRPSDPPPEAPPAPEAAMDEVVAVSDTGSSSDGSAGSGVAGAAIGAGAVLVLAVAGLTVARRRRSS